MLKPNSFQNNTITLMSSHHTTFHNSTKLELSISIIVNRK